MSHVYWHRGLLALFVFTESPENTLEKELSLFSLSSVNVRHKDEILAYAVTRFSQNN